MEEEIGKIFATQIEAVTKSSKAKNELRIAEKVLAQEDANATLTGVSCKMITKRDGAIKASLRAEELHHCASILATTTLEEMLACETTRNSSTNSLDVSWDKLMAMTKELAAAVRDGKNATCINNLRDTYKTSLDEMATAILTKSENPHSARYPATDTAITTWTSLFSKQRAAQKLESSAITIIETAEEELTTLEENDEARETVIQRRDAAQKSQRRAQKKRHRIQTLAATALEQALLIYNSSQTTPDPHQAQTSPPSITDKIDSPITQNLGDRKRKVAAMKLPEKVVADGSAMDMSGFKTIKSIVIQHTNRGKTGKEWIRDEAKKLHAAMMNAIGPVSENEFLSLRILNNTNNIELIAWREQHDAAQKSQRRAQKMRHQIQTLTATALEQALLIYKSSRTPPDPPQAQTSTPQITNEKDSPKTQTLSDQKQNAAAIEHPKEVVADGVHALHRNAIGMKRAAAIELPKEVVADGVHTLHWSAMGMKEFQTIEDIVIQHRTSYKDLQVANHDKTGQKLIKFLSLKILDNTGIIELIAWRDVDLCQTTKKRRIIS